MVFNWGVRRFGLAAWLIFVLTFSLVLAFESQRTWTAFVAVATLFFIYALFTLPAWLWVGYFWGKAMARFLGIEKPVPKRD